AETQLARRKATADLTAYDLYLRALPHHYTMTAAGNAAALPLLEAAITHDPDFAQAVVMLARAVHRGIYQGWQEDHRAAQRRAVELARRALALDPSDPFVLAHAGYLLTLNAGEHELGEELAARAIELNPNFAEGWLQAAWTAVYNGQVDVAIERFTVAERLDPLSPDVVQLWHGRGVPHYFPPPFPHALATHP